ncbi:hypothetical protein [Natronohydrobacter thiooxidans]|uniref:hypothetical protein n=1 Tax=Natronohydrobacter thiooxidans TaxID=87172 RepID=UPI001114B300|nr:hypothetical protein [Natronohydrobacter thiooxidans]
MKKAADSAACFFFHPAKKAFTFFADSAALTIFFFRKAKTFFISPCAALARVTGARGTIRGR